MRAKSIKKVYEGKHDSFEFDGIWRQALGNPETSGIWLVYGPEKNGKTWFTLMMSDYMSLFKKTLYVSAEQGLGKDFADACKRAGLRAQNQKLKLTDYMSLLEIEELLSKRRAPSIVVLDNLTIYNEEMKYGILRRLMRKFPKTLFILVAHEEAGQPYTSTAKMASKLAKIIVRVRGLAAHVSGRCPGGVINIDEEKAQLYWGAAENEATTKKATI